jgi:beta-galactosidase
MEEVIQTTDEASVIDVSADRTEIKADGTDVSIVTVCLKDAKGRVVPDACKQLVLKTDGHVKILGVGNGDPACHDPERPVDINTHDFKVKAFNGYAQVLIQSQKTAGKASLTVSVEGLKAGKLALTLK